MNCFKCKGKTKVIEVRFIDEGRTIRRRRVCLHCTHRQTSYERDESAIREEMAAKESALKQIIGLARSTLNHSAAAISAVNEARA